VVIPVRNEAKNIINCLEKVVSQNYPSAFFEIIIVDDSSTDGTVALVKDFIVGHPLKSISLIELSHKHVALKKIAITEAVKVAKGDLIISTDADCTMSDTWIATIADYYENHKPAMIAGPVSFSNEKGCFESMQGLEFLSLIASGAASIKLRFPTMCNGANLAYEKAAFMEAGGFETNSKYPSGDDVFLMHKMKAQHKKIAFIKSYDAMVETNAQPTFSAFVNQRKRWVSKSRGYSNAATIVVALIVFLFNFSLLASLLLSFFQHSFFYVFLLSLSAKFIVDFPILTGISSFMKKKKIMYFYIPLQIIYPVYIVFTGFMGLFGKFEWKDRTYSANETTH